MGLLDDLKQQADTLREKQQVTKESVSQNLLRAQGILKDTILYWVEVFNSLKVIKLAIPRDYYLEGGTTKIENLMQCDYEANSRRITVEQRDYLDAVILRFRCAADQVLTIEKQTDPLVQRMREHLWSHNLKFNLREVKNERGYVERGIFTVNCDVPVTITIASDLDKAQIKVTTKNLEKFGEYCYIYDFDEFGKEILEELGKVIIGKPNTYRAMGRHQESMRVTTTTTRLTHDDLVAARQPVTPPGDDAKETTKSFIGNIKSLLKR